MQKALEKATKLLSEGKLKLNKIKRNNIPIDIYNLIKKEDSGFKLSKDGKKWLDLSQVNSWNEEFPSYQDNNLNQYNGVVSIKYLLIKLINILKKLREEYYSIKH